MVQQIQVASCVETLAFGQQTLFLQQFFDELMTKLIEFNLTGLFIDRVVTGQLNGCRVLVFRNRVLML